MKKYFLTFVVLVPLILQASDRYTEQMTRHIESIYKAETAEQFQQAINAFERIGNAEKTKWEPFYYATFGYVLMASNESDLGRKDALLDHAKAMIDKASALRPNDSEIIALEGFINMIRVTVDPATRGPQYSMMAMQSFGKAAAINPNNPRALALMAQKQFGTAAFFNQEPSEACATARKALEVFNSATPADPLSPVWGKAMTEALVANCK
jgi:tetratricopeptide (TPR) repeat protein